MRVARNIHPRMEPQLSQASCMTPMWQLQSAHHQDNESANPILSRARYQEVLYAIASKGNLPDSRHRRGLAPLVCMAGRFNSGTKEACRHLCRDVPAAEGWTVSRFVRVVAACVDRFMLSSCCGLQPCDNLKTEQHAEILSSKKPDGWSINRSLTRLVRVLNRA